MLEKSYWMQNNHEVEDKLQEYFEEWVPAQGKCDHKAGEIIRAINRITYRFYNDGDMIGIDYGNETCNPAARFLMENINDNEIKELINHMWGLGISKIYESNMIYLSELIIKYIENNPSLQSEETDDMFDYFNEKLDRDYYEEDDYYGEYDDNQDYSEYEEEEVYDEEEND